jgi:signal transduction histidine kinase
VVRLGARRELAIVVGIGVGVMLLIGLGAAFASRSVAQAQALEDSERMTRRLADLVVAPLLPAYLAGDPHGVQDLRQAMRNRMSDGYLTEVVVWSSDGRVIYSNKEEDVGQRPDPTPPDVAAAIQGRVTSAFEDDPPEADVTVPAGERHTGNETGPKRYVEVYTPFDLGGQPRMAFEAYYEYHRVDEVANQLLRQTLPLVLGPLVLLQLIQVPVALSLARRLKRHENERSRLLERALSASDRERVRFAGDLHDGPIQDLAGISYALGAVAPSVPERHVALMTRVQDALQRSIQSLRGLMTDLYPPDLRSGTLDETVTALAEQLRADGLGVDVDLGPVPPLPDESVSALYRVVRETLANVTKHAQASTVRISLGLVGTGPVGGDPRARLEIADDGVGVDPGRLDRRAEGHLGLRLLADRVDALGGELRVISGPGQGTTVRVELPAPAGGREDTRARERVTAEP